MNKKKILFVIDSLGCGGAEKSLVTLLSLLDYNKYDVDLMLISRGGIFEQYLPKEVTVIDSPIHSYIAHKHIIFQLVKFIFSIKLRLYQWLDTKQHGAETFWRTCNVAINQFNQKYDVAIAYHQGFPTYYVAKKIFASKKIAWINADLAKAGYRSNYNNKYYNKYNKLVVVSDELANLIREEYPLQYNKITSIYDIISPRQIKFMAKEYRIRHQDRLILVTVGRLVQSKGYDIAIETAKLLKQKGINFIWYFVGEGIEKNNLSTLVEENNLSNMICITGLRPNPYPFIKSCDIYIQPSRHEGFGLTIAEAKILCKPIITTNFPVAYNQITNNHNGLIVDTNAQSIANAIIQLVNNLQLRQKFIQNLECETNNTINTEIKKITNLLDW